MGLKHFDEAVSSYRTAIMLCRQDGSTVEQLVEYLTDFALTLVHIPTAATPNSMLRVSEAKEAYELAIEVMPQRSSLFYEVSSSQFWNHTEVHGFALVEHS